MIRQVGRGREFEKLREYVPGDGSDEIHWKATARRGHPITKVFQLERTQEVYVILAGSGRVKLDEEVVELQTLDAIRVAPEVTRAFEAGPEGLDLIVFGPRCDGDGEVLMGWWAD